MFLRCRTCGAEIMLGKSFATHWDALNDGYEISKEIKPGIYVVSKKVYE